MKLTGPQKYIDNHGVRLAILLLVFILLQSLVGCSTKNSAQETQSTSDEMEKWAAEEWAKEECADEETGIVAENGNIADPLEPLNRAFFVFNDKMYFWVLKPVAQVYSFFLPEDVRVCFRNATQNLLMPIRFTNNILQGKLKNSGIELSRFLINSTVGVYGLADAAKSEFGLESKDEDLGQTIGKYGIGDGFYICWPFFGPSNVRDTVGLVGDSFLNPYSYMLNNDALSGISVQTGFRINQTSLTIGTYEQFKEASFDPYVAVRDAYKQHRDSKIRDTNTSQSCVVYTEEGMSQP